MKKTPVVLLLVFVCVGYGQDRFEKARAEMVENQIVGRGVQDVTTLRAMKRVPRHQFVPSEWINHAYADSPLPIGLGQTISQPYIVALMTESIKPRKGQRVLEVGTGSGYQAAVLAEIVDSVFTIELLPELAKEAGDRLKRLGYKNVVVRQGDGYKGWKEHAPFDAILVTAAADKIPPDLTDQLKDGGIMIIPVGPAGTVQELMMVKKQGKAITAESKIPVRFVPLVHPR